MSSINIHKLVLLRTVPTEHVKNMILGDRQVIIQEIIKKIGTWTY